MKIIYRRIRKGRKKDKMGEITLKIPYQTEMRLYKPGLNKDQILVAGLIDILAKLQGDDEGVLYGYEEDDG